MPFHAFLSVYMGSIFGHQALIQAWKDILIVVLGIIASICLANSSKLRSMLFKPINIAVGIFILISLVVSLAYHSRDAQSFWYGAKIDLEFLILFLIAQLADRHKLEQRIVKILVVTASLVAILGTLQATILDRNFLTHFGYGPHTLMPYQLIDPALPKTIRILGTLAGPNQLGSFLILPICLFLFLLIKQRKLIYLLPLVGSLFALLHSFSRSAWIGVLVAVTVTLIFSLSRKFAIGVTGVIIIMVAILSLQRQAIINQYPSLQYFILHSQITGSTVKTSNVGHLGSLEQGLNKTQQHPLGLGLGSAGPASYKSNATVITENFYLQLAIETGILGLAVFLLISVLLLRDLFIARHISLLAIPCMSALLGLATVNLFLHTWSDSSTALIFWGVAGATIGLARPTCV